MSRNTTKRGLRTVLLTSSLDAGGAERVATTLCNAWAARGDEVLLVATYSGGGTPFYKVSEKVSVVYLANTAGRHSNFLLGYLMRLRALRKVVKSWAPDVVISFLPNVNVATLVGMAFANIPIIVCERSDPTSRPAPTAWRLATRLLYRYADMLTVQTAAVAGKVHALYPGVRKIRAIANPLPPEVASRLRHSRQRRKTILSLGRLSAEKQVNRIIEAFSALAGEFEDWDLHIYGEGSERGALANLIEERKLGGRATIFGQTAAPWDVMAESDLFVMTSQYEGFPNALLESMAVGLPCISFDCPSGPREISDNGRVAMLVPLNDQQQLLVALRRIMADERIREELGRTARNSVLAKYSLEAVLAGWDELFREIGVSSGESIAMCAVAGSEG